MLEFLKDDDQLFLDIFQRESSKYDQLLYFVMFLNRFKIEIKEKILGMIKEGYILEDLFKDWY